jgi:hypothetical protein
MARKSGKDTKVGGKSSGKVGRSAKTGTFSKKASIKKRDSAPPPDSDSPFKKGRRDAKKVFKLKRKS